MSEKLIWQKQILQKVIDIKHFGSFQKLKRVLSWDFRIFNNLRLKKPMKKANVFKRNS